MRRTLATLIILTIAATACMSSKSSNGTAAPSTNGTSNPGSTATPQGTQPTSTVPSTKPQQGGTSGHVCPHRRELLLARTTQNPLPRSNGASPLDRITDSTSFVENMNKDDIDTLAAQGIGLYHVPANEDPLDVAVDVSTNNVPPVPAAPVLLVTPAGHWTFGPGGPYQDAPGDLTVSTAIPAPEQNAPVVGVVDTGYTETAQTVTWLASHVEAADPSLDAEHATPGEIEGHGMFVASVIVRNTPRARVIVAGMANVQPEKFQGVTANGSDPALDDSLSQGAAVQFGKGYNSDEMQLYSAVRRLLARQLEGNASVFTFAALNLSVGSYQCDVLSDQGMAIWAALDLWYRSTHDAPVVAAAGNHGPTSPNNNVEFIPGQAGGVSPVKIPGSTTTSGSPTANFETHPLFGVQSVQPDLTTLSAFSNPGAVSAMGENVCGVRVDGKHTTWSGSSFATAVETAAVAASPSPNAPVSSVLPAALTDGCPIPPPTG